MELHCATGGEEDGRTKGRIWQQVGSKRRIEEEGWRDRTEVG